MIRAWDLGASYIFCRDFHVGMSVIGFRTGSRDDVM